MNGSRSDTSNELQNKRLMEIRENYEHYKKTPQQRNDDMKQGRKELLEHMRRNGANEAAIAMFARDLAAVDAVVANAPEEDPRDKIVSETFNYNDGNPCTAPQKITITSEGSRHWRKATIQDTGSIVYIPMENKFGEFDDTGYETDEEFPEETHTTAIVYKFSGGQETFGYADDDKFDELLVVPDEILKGVRNESAPGSFFSGQSSRNVNQWNPAPEGKVWFKHPFLKKPNGMYLNDCDYYCVKTLIGCPGMRPEIVEKSWRERGLFAYWCPVMQRFITDGERYRLQHWFHNGNGTAQERYYYDQNEMLDMHGGLDKLPTNISSNSTNDDDDSVCFMGVMKAEEVIANRRKRAEANGEVVEIDQEDQKMPAKKQRTF